MTGPSPLRRQLGALLAVMAVLAAVALAGCSGGSSGGEGAAATAPSAGAGERPNVVVILTDDQTLESMRVMENTKRLIADQGTTFSRYYVSFPNCCPSRATYLTGQYSHNNGVRDNVPPNGGVKKLKAAETLPVWLQRSGYYTASIGKYLNGWGEDGDIAPPPGWDHWFGLIDPTTYQYFGYSVSDDGQRRDFGTAEADYQTDVLGAEVVRTIEDGARSGRPFLVSFTPLAPHAQTPERAQNDVEWPLAVPAPRHAGRFADESLPRPGSFDRVDPGMPSIVSARTPIFPPVERQITAAYRLELETLLAVDEWVGRIMAALQDNGVAENTVVMFTSDNGLYHGEHRIPSGKVLLYDPAVHLPLLMTGPGIPKGAVVEVAASNADLAPTIVELAGASPGLAMDGADLRRVLADPSSYASRGVLLENQLGGRRTEGIHTGRYVYLEHGNGDVELYDLASDPDQLRNLAGTSDVHTTQTQLARRLASLRTCAGASCEGALASAGALPPLPPDPGPSQAAAPPPPTRPTTTAPPAGGQQQVAGLVAGLDALFELTDDEAACAATRIAAAPDLLATAEIALVQNARAVGQLLDVVRSCVARDRLVSGLDKALPLFFAGELDATQRRCVAEALAALPPEQFSSVLAVFYDPAAAADPTRRAGAVGLLAGCGADPARILG